MPPPPALPTLSRTQKAAVVVHLLLSEGADPGVADLPRPALRRLVHALASLGRVPPATMRAVVAEFAGELDAAGLRLPRSMGEALSLLDGRIAPDLLAEMASEAPGGAPPDLGAATWEALATMPTEGLMPVLDGETPEVCAILLSKLPPERAAALLSEMEEERADAVTAAFAGTEDVSPEAVARIALSLGHVAGAVPSKGFALPPVARVGAILNAARSGARNALLERLDGRAPEFAAQVRGAVFSWENVPDRLESGDVAKVLREVDNDDLVAAIAPDPEGAIAAFLLGAISARLADQIRSEIEDRGEVEADAVEEAQGRIAAAIRGLEEKGEIVLRPTEAP
ncbi:FliG C-terminal domain-containing protein [Jannaschia sp. W003]|uniref:FliG C-terminal domain-containing protein n=1 Tax=Jannaschia sp. W003 TaxID=2867012 RepID=UPI0021A972F5|nr:FliG C-terminal domain-containing protein [Jannaschia sp. W003]UWQ20182.1 flagellar motor switch protein FliG [Jannaschia sp. W003]